MNWKRLTPITLSLWLSLSWLIPEVLAIKFTPPPTYTLAEADLTSLPPPLILEREADTTIGDLSTIRIPQLKKSKRSKRIKAGKSSKKKRGSKRSQKTKKTLNIKFSN